MGDLPGIISKLDYLQGLGVDAIWVSSTVLEVKSFKVTSSYKVHTQISPFYESPNYDMGYGESTIVLLSACLYIV